MAMRTPHPPSVEHGMLLKLSTYIASLHILLADKDINALHKMVESGIGDVEKIASILAHRTPQERQLIRQVYNERYKEELIYAMRNCTTSYFQALVSMWLFPPGVTDSLFIHRAINGEDSSVEARNHFLVEVACTRTPDELNNIKSVYQKLYKNSIEEDVACHRTGDVRKLLLLLFCAHRYHGEEVKWEVAITEADLLHNKIKENSYCHDEVIRILTTRSLTQVINTMNVYTKISGKNILEDLLPENDADDELRSLLRTTIHCLIAPDSYFHTILGSAIKAKGGADLYTITRVAATREQIDFLKFQHYYYTS